jgi:hypothetical protein
LKITMGGELLRPILEEHEGNRIPEVDFWEFRGTFWWFVEQRIKN